MLAFRVTAIGKWHVEFRACSVAGAAPLTSVLKRGWHQPNAGAASHALGRSSKGRSRLAAVRRGARLVCRLDVRSSCNRPGWLAHAANSHFPPIVSIKPSMLHHAAPCSQALFGLSSPGPLPRRVPGRFAAAAVARAAQASLSETLSISRPCRRRCTSAISISLSPIIHFPDSDTRGIISAPTVPPRSAGQKTPDLRDHLDRKREDERLQARGLPRRPPRPKPPAWRRIKTGG